MNWDLIKLKCFSNIKKKEIYEEKEREREKMKTCK